MAQGIDDKLDESLGMKDGPEDIKDQSMADRRDESLGASGPDIGSIIAGIEDGLASLKAHPAVAASTGGGELIEDIGIAEELPGGDILGEDIALAEPMPPMPPMPLGAEGLPMPEEEEAFDLDALTAAAAKNALA